MYVYFLTLINLAYLDSLKKGTKKYRILQLPKNRIVFRTWQVS